MMFLFVCAALPFPAAGAVGPRWEIIPEDTDYPFFDLPVAAMQVTDDRLTHLLPDDPANEDCTATFQEAIDAVQQVGGGMVFVPKGEYLIRGNLVVRQGVTLRGHWQAPTDTGWKTGTVLKLVPDLSAEDDPASIEAESNTGIKSLNFYYPEQDPNHVRAYLERRDAAGVGLQYVIEYGEDLASWTSTGITEGNRETIDSDYDQVTVSVPESSSTRQFLRIRVGM